MNAELLREAATKMRERSQAATPGPWFREYGDVITATDDPRDVEEGYEEPRRKRVLRRAPHLRDASRQALADAAHVASWDPTVTLAVADWLELTADQLPRLGPAYRLSEQVAQAVTVARAYLGRPE